jgi:hypothetical protein
MHKDDDQRLCEEGSGLGIERLNCCLEERPVGLPRQPHQRMLEVDDVLQPRAEQVVGVGSLQLLRLHSPPPLQASGSRESYSRAAGNRPSQIASFQPGTVTSWQSSTPKPSPLRLPRQRLASSSRTTSDDPTQVAIRRQRWVCPRLSPGLTQPTATTQPPGSRTS